MPSHDESASIPNPTTAIAPTLEPAAAPLDGRPISASTGVNAGSAPPVETPAAEPLAADAIESTDSDGSVNLDDVIPLPDVVIRTPPTLSHHRSSGGRPLAYWVFGREGPTTLILGGMHGGENTPTRVCYQFIQWLETTPDAVAAGRIVVAPLVDPDGFESGRRGNAHGVDLNRNYPARNWQSRGNRHGPSPVSETETSFVMDLLADHDPACILSVHAALACVNYDGPAEDLARRMSRACGLPVRASVGYPTPGSFGSYAGTDLEIPTITLELRSSRRIDPSFDECRDALLAAHQFNLETTAQKPD